MKRSIFPHVSALMLLFCLFLVSSSITAGAEEEVIPIEAQSGWLGVYIGGVKVGHSNWSIERKTAGKKEYYRIYLLEERVKEIKDKEVKSTYEYKATVSLGLSPLKLDYTEKSSGRTTTVKGRVKGDKASMVVSFDSKPFPPKKLTIKPASNWAFCAPLAWAWRSLSYDKPQLYNQILEKNSVFKSTKLTGAESKITFEGEEVDAIVWTDEAGTMSIATDGAGKFYESSTKSKKGVETKYVSETEDLALSNMNYEQYKAKKKKKPGKKKGKKGDDDSPFEDPLEPVDEDADFANSGEYMKLKTNGDDGESLSIRAAEGWTCVTGKANNQPVFLVINKEDQSIQVRLLIVGQSQGDDSDVVLESFIEQLEEAGFGNIKYLEEEEIMVFEQGEKEFAYSKISCIIQNTKTIGFILAMPGETLDACYTCFIPASDADNYEDDILSMLGSARFE